MRKSALLIALSVSILTWQAVYATGMDQFTLSAVLPFDKVVDVAGSGEQFYVLGSGTLSLLDNSLPGPEISRISSIEIGEEFTQLSAYGRVVALTSADGAIELYEQVEDDLIRRCRIEIAGSIEAAVMREGRLCLARGYSGVRIYDISDLSRPRIVQNLTEPDLASGIDVSPEFLFVLDALNGVTVYSWSGDSLHYLDEIRTDLPPIDIGANRSGVGICFGTKHLEYWHCSKTIGAELDFATELDFQPSCISGFRNAVDPLLLGSEAGDIVVYKASTRAVFARDRLAYPIAGVLVTDDFFPFPFVAVDKSSLVTAFKGDAQLSLKKSFAGKDTPAAAIATNYGLVVSTSRGLELIRSDGEFEVTQSLIVPAPTFLTLAQATQFVFAGSAADGRIWIFANERNGWAVIGQISSGLTLNRLFVQNRVDGSVELIAAGREGVRSFISEDSIHFIENWTLSATMPLTCAAVSGNYLALADEVGNLQVYLHNDSGTRLTATTEIPLRPRDLEIVRDSFIVAAHSDGITVLAIEQEGAHLQRLGAPTAVYSAFDVLYEPSAHELIVADGPNGVKYLDFSIPAHLGIVYTIQSTENAVGLDYRGEELFVSSSNWLRVFDRTGQGTQRLGGGEPIMAVEAFPNPFNSNSEVSIELNQSVELPVHIAISLVNILGQTVAADDYEMTVRQMRLRLPQLTGDNELLSSGVYFFVARAQDQVVTRKLLLLK